MTTRKDANHLVRLLLLAVVIVPLGLLTLYLQYFEPSFRLVALLLSYVTLFVFLWGFPGTIHFWKPLRSKLAVGGRLRLPKFSLTRLMLAIVLTFGFFLYETAYGLVLNSIVSGRVVYDVLSLVVAVEGVLLGLLSLSPERREAGKSRRVAGLAFLTFIGILLSLSTIIFAEANPPIDTFFLSVFFLTSVWVFSIVVIVYAGIIMTEGSQKT